MSWLVIRLWWGQLNFKWVEDSLFSERNGRVPSVAVGPIRITWRERRTY